MSRGTSDESGREIRQTAGALSRQHDLTKPGPHPLSLGEAMHEIETEYRDALELLGKS